jgi:hypothetical protein
MESLVAKIESNGLNRDGARAARKSLITPRNKATLDSTNDKRNPFIYRYSSPDGFYKVTISFNSQLVTDKEIRTALKTAIDNITVRKGSDKAVPED